MEGIAPKLPGLRISDVGEKTLIREFIKPLFNGQDDPSGVGDDCAMVPFGDEVVLLSTDRVPCDLTAFRHGILDFHGMGDYLARLNLSDIAACGGRAIGLLLNLGLPDSMAYEDVRALCHGFGECGDRHGVPVLGGDITSAGELSLSATSIGKAPRGRVLSRRGARPGDSIFISRPLGLTPAAFHVFLNKLESQFTDESVTVFRRQFTDLEPMFALGQALGASGECGACMDNTDGVGQSLFELSESSKCALVIQESALRYSPEVEQVARITGLDARQFVFNGGADFSLVGTVRGQWSSESATLRFGHQLEIIGRVEEGMGLWLEDAHRTPLEYRGWNYFRERP